MQQNIHLLTNSNAGLPTDIWVPSTNQVKPQESSQIATALTRTLDDGVYEINLEAYYKTMDNLITYKEGSSFMSFRDWQETIETNGEGTSYGMELFLQKKRGKHLVGLVTPYLGPTDALTTLTLETGILISMIEDMTYL